MTTAPLTPARVGEIMEMVIAKGDLGRLSPAERGKYYVRVCESVGLNPMTRPFEYLSLNGRLVLYARKDCTDQLRSLYGISVVDMHEGERGDIHVVTVKVCNAAGRTDMAKGAVPIGSLKGEALANALMKAETKAKRRATLSICGLGFLDETEVEDISPSAKGPPPPDMVPPPPPPGPTSSMEDDEIPQDEDEKEEWNEAFEDGGDEAHRGKTGEPA
jgi:hypothetical protein